MVVSVEYTKVALVQCGEPEEMLGGLGGRGGSLAGPYQVSVYIMKSNTPITGSSFLTLFSSALLVGLRLTGYEPKRARERAKVDGSTSMVTCPPIMQWRMVKSPKSSFFPGYDHFHPHSISSPFA